MHIFPQFLAHNGLLIRNSRATTRTVVPGNSYRDSRKFFPCHFISCGRIAWKKAFPAPNTGLMLKISVNLYNFTGPGAVNRHSIPVSTRRKEQRTSQWTDNAFTSNQPTKLLTCAKETEKWGTLITSFSLVPDPFPKGAGLEARSG